jgi:hypothetical protein
LDVPHVTVTNSSDSPITITSIELVAKRGTYINKPRYPESYPLDVPPGKAEILSGKARAKKYDTETFRKWSKESGAGRPPKSRKEDQ